MNDNPRGQAERLAQEMREQFAFYDVYMRHEVEPLVCAIESILDERETIRAELLMLREMEHERKSGLGTHETSDYHYKVALLRRENGTLRERLEVLLHEREEMREALDISLKAIELMQAVGLPAGDEFVPDSLPGRAMSAARNALREGGRCE